jgi:hypothetical protein
MKKQEEQHITRDINTFDEAASIYKILFQDRTTALLKYIIDKIAIDRYESKGNRLPAIMVAGKYGGKQLISRAFSNSMCAKFEHIYGRHLGLGGCCGSLYQDVHEETVYYISSADKLNAYSITLLHKFLMYGFIQFKNPITKEEVTVSANNKLFVLSVNDPKKLCPDLYKAINYHCYLKNYSTMEMEILVEQRLKWCSVDYEKQIPAIIARNGEGSIKNCIRLLSLCCMVIRSNNTSKMTIKDVEKGIGLSRSRERIGPPSIPGDISY